MPRYPIADSDYPEDWLGFHKWFPSDKACALYLAKLRWRDGFVCPVCQSTSGWITHDN